jgi:hypothetical protein
MVDRKHAALEPLDQLLDDNRPSPLGHDVGGKLSLGRHCTPLSPRPAQAGGLQSFATLPYLCRRPQRFSFR